MNKTITRTAVYCLYNLLFLLIAIDVMRTGIGWLYWLRISHPLLIFIALLVVGGFMNASFLLNKAGAKKFIGESAKKFQIVPWTIWIVGVVLLVVMLSSL